MVLYLAVGKRDRETWFHLGENAVCGFVLREYICAVSEGLEVFGINMIIDAMEVRS